jgi:ribose-phosphate pyrophosphokinase
MTTILVNAKPIKTFNFPGGECQVALNNESFGPSTTIIARITDSNGIMQLLLTTDALRRVGVKDISLFMPYVPYARQDRVCNPGEAHSLKVFANLINSQNYRDVAVFDPHSDVTEALFDNCRIHNNHQFVRETIFALDIQNNFSLISPDAGAYKKVFYLGKDLQRTNLTTFDIVNCNKERDTKTGVITNFTVNGISDLQGKPCLVVDDICDGGGTFLGLATELKARNAGPLYLVVSHGIFSQGFDKLLQHYEKIVFTNSFKDHEIPEQYKDRLITMRLF